MIKHELPEDYAVFNTGADGWWYAVWIERWGNAPWRVIELTDTTCPPGKDLAYVKTFYTREDAVKACWENYDSYAAEA